MLWLWEPAASLAGVNPRGWSHSRTVETEHRRSWQSYHDREIWVPVNDSQQQPYGNTLRWTALLQRPLCGRLGSWRGRTAVTRRCILPPSWNVPSSRGEHSTLEACGSSWRQGETGGGAVCPRVQRKEGPATSEPLDVPATWVLLTQSLHVFSSAGHLAPYTSIHRWIVRSTLKSQTLTSGSSGDLGGHHWTWSPVRPLLVSRVLNTMRRRIAHRQLIWGVWGGVIQGFQQETKQEKQSPFLTAENLVLGARNRTMETLSVHKRHRSKVPVILPSEQLRERFLIDSHRTLNNLFNIIKCVQYVLKVTT